MVLIMMGRLTFPRAQYNDAEIDWTRTGKKTFPQRETIGARGRVDIIKQLKPLFTKLRDEGDYDLIPKHIHRGVGCRKRVDISQLVIDRFDTATQK